MKQGHFLTKILAMNTINLLFQNNLTPREINLQIAQRLRKVRRRRKISQKELSVKSGVSLGSVKRFETTGDVSLLSLTKIAMALDLQDSLLNLFADVPFQSLEEIKNE